jgi:hypothetical protein
VLEEKRSQFVDAIFKIVSITMFILSVLKDTIKIEPTDFRKPKQEAITDEVNKKYANKVSI